MTTFDFEDWGITDYDLATAKQREYLAQIIGGSRNPTLIFTEHQPVLTLGANFHSENLLRTRIEIEGLGIQILESDRGGDVTYHGPGQLVAYPLFPLSWVDRDVHRWLRELEQVVLATLATYDIKGHRFAPHTGVWIGNRKVCAMGVKIRRWVSMHGIALNCDLDLAPFENIIPCGIQNYGVTSISQELGFPVTVHDTKPRLRDAFAYQFSNERRSVV